MDREATPKLLIKLGIQLHLAGLSLSNTVSTLEISGVERARSTVHNWVHTAGLQPEGGRCPDRVAVDETVIRLNDERYWLYAAVDPETNELLPTKLDPTTTKVLARSFLTERSEKHGVGDVVFLVDGSHSLQDACQRRGFDFRLRNIEIRMPLNVSLAKQNAEIFAFQTVSATPRQKPPTTGSDRSASHGIGLSEEG